MYFYEFQKTRTFHLDLSEPTSAEFDDPNQSGFTYVENLYIECNKHTPDRGLFHLILGRDSWCTDDLVSLERKLYVYALFEGVISAEDMLVETLLLRAHSLDNRAVRKVITSLVDKMSIDDIVNEILAEQNMPTWEAINND